VHILIIITTNVPSAASFAAFLVVGACFVAISVPARRTGESTSD
jgi:hypothetical protein